MSWFYENQRYWRTSFLVLLALAISGPWWFDRIWVPAPYTCDTPNIIRLDETFCGFPLSITWFYTTFLGEITSLVAGQTTNALSFDEAARTGLFIVWTTLPLLPVLTTALILLRGDHQRGYLFHRVGLGLAAGLAGLFGILGFSSASWSLWGLWLYLFLALSMLLLELWIFKVNRRLVHE